MTGQQLGKVGVKELPPADAPSKNQAIQLALGLLFGVIFGFLLQKGGVGKYEVLIGMLLLKDFTVLQVMLSAVVVGMLGIWALHAGGFVKFHIKPTRYGSNVLGGILFGVGFGLAAYCPGTSATALGQGNFDALAVMLGLLAGSYVFAEASGWIARTVNRWGDRGELTLPELLGIRPAIFVPLFAAVIVLFLSAVHFSIVP
ncbi:MAG: YeeE/YedE family protein, partial [Planctomycetaceae bacterium]